MHIQIIPTLDENYSYLLIEHGEALAIDPGDSAPIWVAMRAAGVTLRSVLLTHCHGDHTAGCSALRRACSCAIMGPAECEAVGLDRVVRDGDTLPVGSQMFRVLSIPGHTQGHVAYHSEASQAVWTGDTLFIAGCGRIMAGAAEAMWLSLQRLRALPADTAVYCGQTMPALHGLWVWPAPAPSRYSPNSGYAKTDGKLRDNGRVIRSPRASTDMHSGEQTGCQPPPRGREPRRACRHKRRTLMPAKVAPDDLLPITPVRGVRANLGVPCRREQGWWTGDSFGMQMRGH